MTSLIQRFLADETGGTAIEYGLIAALVGMGIVVGLSNVTAGLTELFDTVKEQIPD
ncbi:Flp family type IVb pilin [Hyphomicrobium sp. CS1GBMeth3]|uniref:Flp family type IVb pilin n=1 Tax=Hyphomicrobium sp. CS1GBMeth3 TaxID=1892845 RepID=UPI000930CC4D|nr:Flp family type IVb pilin [Hyphomicrobium sp. CS1GBMeth3]